MVERTPPLAAINAALIALGSDIPTLQSDNYWTVFGLLRTLNEKLANTFIRVPDSGVEILYPPGFPDGFAEKPIYILNPVFESSPLYEEILGMNPVFLNGDLKKI